MTTYRHTITRDDGITVTVAMTTATPDDPINRDLSELTCMSAVRASNLIDRNRDAIARLDEDPPF